MSAALRPDPPSRWWRFLRERRLKCPHGHHIPHTFAVTEAGFVRCPHRGGPGGDYRTECGAWIFLFAVRGGAIIVAQVELTEVEPMKRLETPAAMLEYLGIWT
jgi:hypothetical protein